MAVSAIVPSGRVRVGDMTYSKEGQAGSQEMRVQLFFRRHCHRILDALGGNIPFLVDVDVFMDVT